MKKYLLFISLLIISGGIFAQSVLRYEFANSLDEKNGLGPALTVLGTEGTFMTDTLNEINNFTKTVYRFDYNCGLQLDNAAAGNFIGNSFTIELYFVFDNLNSWKRVVDWKNRSSDGGAYIYNGQLNFYPVQYSGDAPVVAGEYTYYVITRDGATNQALFYTDDGVQINFIDDQGLALIDVNNVLNFFQDDLQVTGEASSGAVALLNLYNYVLDSTTIKQNFENIGGTVFSVNEPKKQTGEMGIYPNPASVETTLDLSNYTGSNETIVTIQNLLGQTVFSTRPNTRETTQLNVDISAFPKGIYLVRAESSDKSSTKKLIIQ
jgi:hypothetical protein